MKLVIFSSVSGIDVSTCVGNLATYGASTGTRSVGPFKVEEKCVEVATPTLERLYPGTQHTLAQFLTLPSEHICDCCTKGFQETMAMACTRARQETAELVFVAFHPVLFHQRTTGFVEPYQGADLRAAVPEDVGVERVVSIHDDIFDMYKKLLGPHLLFDPSLTRESGEREPLQDFQDLMLLLDWRDRELSAAVAIAQGLGSRHFLFHAKGRTRSLWEAVCKNRPSVYLSHPISQPRRDILGISDPEKCTVPDKERGRDFVVHCVALANLLSEFVPLVEPTAIDEFRLDLARLEGLRECDLQDRLLPPLTERWPIPQDRLLCGQIDDAEDNGLVRVASERFEGLAFSDAGLGPLAGASHLLAREIRRQINVRDHFLAEQAGLVVAFRPFSLPDSPAPTGGVEKEVDVLIRKTALGAATCVPGIIIIHPLADERRRRENEFRKAWTRLANKFLVDPNGDEAKGLRQACLDVLLAAPADAEDQEVISTLSQVIAQSNVRLHPLTDASSMAEHGIVREEKARSQMANEMVGERSILRSKLQEDAGIRGPEVLIFRDGIGPGVEFAELVKGTIEKGIRHD